MLKEINAFIEEESVDLNYRFPFEIESVFIENTTESNFENNLGEETDTDIDEINDFHEHINNNNSNQNSINTMDSIDTLSDPG